MNLFFSLDFRHDQNKVGKINHKLTDINCLHNRKSIVIQDSIDDPKEHLSETLNNLNPKQYNWLNYLFMFVIKETHIKKS